MSLSIPMTEAITQIEYTTYCQLLQSKQISIDNEYNSILQSLKYTLHELNEKYAILQKQYDDILYTMNEEFHSLEYDEEAYYDICLTLEWCKYDIEKNRNQENTRLETMDFVKQYYSWNLMIMKLKQELLELITTYTSLQEEKTSIQINEYQKQMMMYNETIKLIEEKVANSKLKYDTLRESVRE